MKLKYYIRGIGIGIASNKDKDKENYNYNSIHTDKNFFSVQKK